MEKMNHSKTYELLIQTIYNKSKSVTCPMSVNIISLISVKLTLLDLAQKQPTVVFYKISVLKNFAKFAGKHKCQILF